MTGLRDIQEPPCPFDEDAFKGCLAFTNGALTYYINRRCRASLLWSFWFDCAKSPIGEDSNLKNDFYDRFISRENWVRFGEATVIPNEHKKLRDNGYPYGYRQDIWGMNFYVTKSEFARAFRVIRQLGRKRKGVVVREGIIFQCVRVVLLEDGEFGEKVEGAGVMR